MSKKLLSSGSVYICYKKLYKSDVNFAPVQGEGGKPGERGVMGAVGATVSICAFLLPSFVHSVLVWALFYCVLCLTLGRSR